MSEALFYYSATGEWRTPTQHAREQIAQTALDLARLTGRAVRVNADLAGEPFRLRAGTRLKHNI